MKGLVVSITDYFVKYRREWLSKYDNFILLVYVYLYRFNSIEHYVPVTIKDIVSFYKFKPDRNSGRINDKFKMAIKSLIDMGYITFIRCYSNNNINSFVEEDSTDKNIKFAVNDNSMIWLKLNNFDDVDYWNPSGDFVQFMYFELDTILNHKDIKNVDKVISAYLNIKKWISVVDSNTARFVAFPSENQLANDIGCSPKSIQEYVKQLITAKLIYKKNYGSFKRLRKGEEIKQNSNAVYALDRKYLDGKYDKDALREYLKFNYQMIGDDFEPFNQPLNEYQKNNKLKVADDSVINSSLDSDNKSISAIKDTDNTENTFVSNDDFVVIDNVSAKVDMNPFHEDANPVVKPYKPFGGVFEDTKKQNSIRDMDDTEFFDYMGWMENHADEVDNVDIFSISNDSEDNDKMPWEIDKYEEEFVEELFG